MKKQNNKHVRKNSIYNGRNVYGDPCIAKFVKLEKETAVDQYLAILADIETAHGKAIEYTVDSSCFTREEAVEFSNKLACIMELRARIRGYAFCTGDISIPRIAA